MASRTHNLTRGELLEWNPREHNVYAPKGVMRSRAKFVTGGPLSPRQTWTYRGWRIDVREHADGRFDSTLTMPRGTTITVSPSPGEAEALQAAVFSIDRAEALNALMADSLSARNRMGQAEEAVRRALDDLVDAQQPQTRATVARQIQLMERGSELVAEWAQAFRDLAVHERLELIDELLAVASTHGGRVPQVA